MVFGAAPVEGAAPMVKVSVLPLPTCRVTEPVSASAALTISARYPLEVCARLLTVTVCVPALAVEEAEVSSSTLVLELDPVFCARMPLKSVSWLISLERLENSAPRLEIAVSWLSRDVNCDFHGVSTPWRLATICDTVALTSNPAPLVGEPKLNPTVPIHFLRLK